MRAPRAQNRGNSRAPPRRRAAPPGVKRMIEPNKRHHPRLTGQPSKPIGLLATVAAGLPFAVAWDVISALLSQFHVIGTGYLSMFRWVAEALGEPV